jgi:hypothetical protein
VGVKYAIKDCFWTNNGPSPMSKFFKLKELMENLEKTIAAKGEEANPCKCHKDRLEKLHELKNIASSIETDFGFNVIKTENLEQALGNYLELATGEAESRLAQIHLNLQEVFDAINI